MAIRTPINFSTGFAPLSLLTGRDFSAPLRALRCGNYEPCDEDSAKQEAEEDACRMAAGNEELENEEYVMNFKRAVDTRLPFFPGDEGDPGYNPAKYRKRTTQCRGADAQKSHRAAKMMALDIRATAAEHVKKKVAQYKAQHDMRFATERRDVTARAKVLIRDGQITARMHGRLRRKLLGPYEVTSVAGGTAKYVDSIGAAHSANIANVRTYKDRGGVQWRHRGAPAPRFARLGRVRRTRLHGRPSA